MADDFADSFQYGLRDLPMEPPDVFNASNPAERPNPMAMSPHGTVPIVHVEVGQPRPLTAVERGEREHEKRLAAIAAERDVIEKRAQAKETRWRQQKEKLKRVAQPLGDG